MLTKQVLNITVCLLRLELLVVVEDMDFFLKLNVAQCFLMIKTNIAMLIKSIIMIGNMMPKIIE